MEKYAKSVKEIEKMKIAIYKKLNFPHFSWKNNGKIYQECFLVNCLSQNTQKMGIYAKKGPLAFFEISNIMGKNDDERSR